MLAITKETNYSDRIIQSYLRSKRWWILYHSIATQPPSTTDANQLGPIMRSDTEVYDDWVTHSDTSKMKTTKEQNLHRYPLEQLWVTEDKTKLLILVNIDGNYSLFAGKGSKIDKL